MGEGNAVDTSSPSARRLRRERVRQDVQDWQETAPAGRSSELLVLLVAGLGLLTTATLDPGLTIFQVWCLLTALAVGYMLSRGLAKAGVPWRRDATTTEYRTTSPAPSGIADAAASGADAEDDRASSE